MGIIGVLVLLKINNPFFFGVLTGSIIQGLLYRDRFVVLYKKENFEKIYARFK
jgi:hypothetical protein